MKAMTLEKPGLLVPGETPEPGPLPSDHALVKVRCIGVCGTDIHAFNGKQPFFKYPRILGHELGVEVLEVMGHQGDIRPGDRCSVEPYLNCGKCVACRNGKGNCCTQLQVLGVHIDGGHREFLHIPLGKLHKSSKLSFEQLALIEPLAIGAHAVKRAALQPGETVLVIGAGPIGLSVIQFALAAGGKVIVMDVNENRLSFCRSNMGVTHTIQAGSAGAVQLLTETGGGDLPTAVFDATGNPRSMQDSFLYPAHGGRLIFVGLFQGDVTFHDPDFHKKELTLMASRNAASGDFSRIISMVESGKIDTSPWITHRSPFDEVPAVFEAWTKPGNAVLKAMIVL